MHLFFAGTEYHVFGDLVKNNGGVKSLQSAFYLNYKREPNEKKFEYYLLDSGGFSARNLGKIIKVQDYIDFINKWKVKVAFNLDTLDVDETLENQSLLEKYTDAYIIPVYHYSEYKSRKYRGLLETYAAKYPYIGIGGTAEGARGVTHIKRELFNHCFKTVKDKVKLHGLAVTAYNLILEYPWFSVDSTSWLSPESFGKVFDFKDGKLLGYNSLRVTKGLVQHPDQFNTTKFYNTTQAIKVYCKMESHVTNLWKARGVTFNEWPFTKLQNSPVSETQESRMEL